MTLKTPERRDTMNPESRKERNEMTEAARLARNAYKRRWAKEHPDKVKEACRRYWERKAAQEQTVKTGAG